jgi:hypothetical protein
VTPRRRRLVALLSGIALLTALDVCQARCVTSAGGTSASNAPCPGHARRPEAPIPEQPESADCCPALVAAQRDPHDSLAGLAVLDGAPPVAVLVSTVVGASSVLRWSAPSSAATRLHLRIHRLLI